NSKRIAGPTSDRCQAIPPGRPSPPVPTPPKTCRPILEGASGGAWGPRRERPRNLRHPAPRPTRCLPGLASLRAGRPVPPPPPPVPFPDRFSVGPVVPVVLHGILVRAGGTAG